MKSDGSYDIVSASLDTDSSPYIGVPSRVHDLNKDKSKFPLAGLRVSVKDLYYSNVLVVYSLNVISYSSIRSLSERHRRFRW